MQYGVGKQRCLLEFFRKEGIKQAFCQAFDHYNPLILLGEVESFLDAYALGDEIKALQYRCNGKGDGVCYAFSNKNFSYLKRF